MIHHAPALFRRALVAAAAAVALLLGAGCSGPTEPMPPPGAPDQVTYITGFGLFGRDGWIYCGIDQGHFSERNIEVSVEGGTGTAGNFELLLSGRAQFVTTDLVGDVIALGEGTGEWKAVAAIQQLNLSSWMTLDPDLTTVADLEGKTIGLPPGAVTETLFPTYASLAGADPDTITVEHLGGPDLPGALAGGQVDAIGQFAVGQPLISGAAQGAEVYVHPYTDVLTDLYGQALVTTDELIADNPDLVERFRDATLEGLEWSLNNPEQCGEIMGEYEEIPGPPDRATVIAGEELSLMVPYARVGGAPLGGFDSRRLARMIATLEGSGAIPPGITPDDVVAFDLAPAAG